uniref:Bet v I/Major latex protein domain-containing protein n=1 Tax=Populus trichocarpa TaxID=3694 RepID=A0A2K1ZL11_POPTR
MGVFTYESEASTVMPPARLFKALFVDAAEVMPKALPQAIKSIVTLEGDGGPGTIKQTYFGDGQYVASLVAYTVFEGDALANTYEKIFNESKIEASPDGGSVCKTSTTYYTVGNMDAKADEIKDGQEKQMGLFKAIEAYLLANPDA